MPKRVDLVQQRRAISSAAISVIDRTGLEGARLRDVARAASVTTGAVTHYFDSKDAVLEAALGEIVQRTLKRMESRRVASAPGDVEAFIRRVSAYLPIDEQSRKEWRVWMAFWGRAIADERLRTIHRNYYDEIIETVIGPLQLLRSGRPKLSRRRLRKYADASIAAIDGVSTRATLEPELWPVSRQRETVAELLRPMLGTFVRE
jgi:TetR/AcrR family transcriptional regulator, transcriptional repressor of bet genes